MEVGKVQPFLGYAPPTDVTLLSPKEREEQREMIRAVSLANTSQMFGDSNELVFTFDRSTRRSILRIVDKKTEEVIRQIPAEYLLELTREAQDEDGLTRVL